jgi:hypothetical protein
MNYVLNFDDFLLEKKKKDFINVSKPEALKSKIAKADKTASLDGVSLGKDKDGYFVYTHRARSKSHKTAEGIPVKDVVFIETTG